MSSLPPVLAYTLGRVACFAAVAAVLYLVGFRSWVLAMAALLLSMPLSWVLLRSQRSAFAVAVSHRAERRRAERERLRAALRGDDPPAGA